MADLRVPSPLPPSLHRKEVCDSPRPLKRAGERSGVRATTGGAKDHSIPSTSHSFSLSSQSPNSK